MKIFAGATLVALMISCASAADAATYVQYEAHFSGGVSGYSLGANRFFSTTGDATVVINLPIAVDATTTGYFGYTSTPSLPGGTIRVGYGNPESYIIRDGMGFDVQEQIEIYLGAATNGGLTDFEAARGFYYLNNYTPASFIANMTLTSFTTRFSDSPFTGPAETTSLNIGPIALPSVPEPAIWTMFIGGFGMVGAAMRRKAILHFS